MQALDAMRKNAGSISRAVSEQATAAEQISKEAGRSERLVANVARAMSEQATGATQITTAAESMRVQAEQAAKATAEQAQAITDLNGASNNIAKQIKLISRANREHSVVAAGFLTSLGEIKGITERNASGAKETVNRTNGLLNNARRLNGDGGDAFGGRQVEKRQWPARAERYSPGETAESPTRGRKRKS